MTTDFVYENVYKECLKRGCKDTVARNAAQKLVDDYKKGKFRGKLSKHIEDAIKEAVKQNKKCK